MAKTKEELKELKKQFEELTSKISDLSEEELEEVAGGDVSDLLDIFKKMGEGIHSTTKPVVKTHVPPVK